MNKERIYFKHCPRCGGDVVADTWFRYIEYLCGQCGWRSYQNKTSKLEIDIKKELKGD